MPFYSYLTFLNVHLYTHGTAEFLACLHCFYTKTATHFEMLAPELSQHRTIALVFIYIAYFLSFPSRPGAPRDCDFLSDFSLFVSTVTCWINYWLSRGAGPAMCWKLCGMLGESEEENNIILAFQRRCKVSKQASKYIKPCDLWGGLKGLKTVKGQWCKYM